MKNDFEPNIFVSSALVDMYVKCHDIGSAIKIFRKIEDKNTVAWNSVIAGHIYNSQPEEAFKLFHKMLSEGAEPSSITMLILLLGCGEMGALYVGRQLHSFVVKHNLDELHNKLLTALIDMYAKFNCISDAKLVFDFIVNKDLGTWNSMISAYAINGMAENAIALFQQMEMLGIVPDNKTFLALLTACSRDGLVDEGCFYLDTLLQACRVHSNTIIEQRAAKVLFELERNDVTSSSSTGKGREFNASGMIKKYTFSIIGAGAIGGGGGGELIRNWQDFQRHGKNEIRKLEHSPFIPLHLEYLGNKVLNNLYYEPNITDSRDGLRKIKVNARSNANLLGASDNLNGAIEQLPHAADDVEDMMVERLGAVFIPHGLGTS
ncbi:hypothetical protein LguiA_004736 [Lonicera macranthoides]